MSRAEAFRLAGRPVGSSVVDDDPKGVSLADVGAALPEPLRPKDQMLRAVRHQQAEGTIALERATIHLLGEVREKVSSTQIRAAAHKSVKQLSRYVPRLVAEYIKKEHLYIDSAEREKVLSFEESRQRHAGRSHKNG